MKQKIFTLLFFGISILALAQKKTLSELDSIYNYGRSFAILGSAYGDSVSRKILTPLSRKAQLEQNLKVESQCYHLLTFVYEQTHQDSFYYYANKAVDLYQKTNNVYYMDVLNYLGYYAVDKGLFEESLKAYQKSLDYAEEHQDSVYIGFILGEQGYVYDRMEDYNQALIYYRKALSYLNDSSNRSFVYGKIGIAYDELKNYDSALYYNYIAVNYFRALNIPYNLAIWQSNIGNTLSKLELWDSAISSLTESVYIMDTLNKSPLPNALLNLGTAYLNTHQKLKSKAYLDRGLAEAEKQQLVRSIYEGYYQQYLWHKANNEPNEALNYFEQFNHLKDSIINIERLELASKLQLKYETEKKDKEIAETKIRYAEQKLKLEKESFKFIFLLGTLLLILILGAWLFYAQRQKRLRAAQVFEHQKNIEEAKHQQNISNEKLRISRELHDNIGSQITLMVSSVDNLSYREKDESIKSKLSNISAFGRDAMIDLRNTIWAMKLTDGTKTVLFQKVIELKSKINPPPEIEITNACTKNDPLNATQILNAYRIVQEAIQNTVKHANANKINVNFSDADALLSISILDDGDGFDLALSENGNGLVNMQSRAETINGLLKINSFPGKGTTVELKIN